MKACAKAEAATDGDVFVRLVVTFLRRTPRCIIATKVGAWLPIEEIGPDGKKLDRLATPADRWGNVINLQYNTESELPMEIKVKGLSHRFGNTYNVIGNFVLGVDHVAVRKSRFAE